MTTFETFQELDIRVGTVLEARVFEGARKPAYQLLVDFGAEIGVLKSSAQITELYAPQELIGRQVLGVVNFPPRQIGKFMSQALVLGVYTQNGVVLIQPDRGVENGVKLG